MKNKNVWDAFWRVWAFRVIIAISLLFIALTLIAMPFYPGGTLSNPRSQGYAFFINFLSDLGRSSSLSGQPNLLSRVLFTLALSVGAVGIALFFLAFTQLFPESGRARWCSRLGAGSGLLASLCFLGVAGVPLDLSSRVHNVFLDAALISFLGAFLLIFLAVLFKPGLPRHIVGIFVAFGVILASYTLLLIFLLFFGPPLGSPLWEIIQATGQKMIVYASILTALIQALNLPPLLARQASASGKAGER